MSNVPRLVVSIHCEAKELSVSNLLRLVELWLNYHVCAEAVSVSNLSRLVVRDKNVSNLSRLVW